MDEMMESGLKAFKAAINMISNDKIGIAIYDEDGNIRVRQILSKIGIGNEGSNIDELQFSEGLSEDLTVEGKVLKVAANNFTVAAQLLFSEFDMIHSDTNFLHWQFDNDRISKLRTAENAYQMYLEDLTEENMDSLCMNLRLSRKDAEDSFNALEENIKKNIGNILVVPRERLARLFKGNPKVIKAYEDNARNALHGYMRALSIIVKINSVLNLPADSKRRLDQAIGFFLSFDEVQLNRVEGWNADPDSDGFWIDKASRGVSYQDYLQELISIRDNLDNEQPLLIEVRSYV